MQHESYSIVSDEMHHDKKAVYAFNSKIIGDVQAKLPWTIQFVHFWSDGAASQVKNRHNFANLVHHKEDFGCFADWSFFATSHGKGPIDGIGGEVKRSVWREVLKGKAVFNDAFGFYQVASKLNAKINILNVSQTDIEGLTVNLQKAGIIPKLWSVLKHFTS